MADWVDPRTDPSPPYRGPERPLARDGAGLEGLIAACKDGRLYDAEAWVAEGKPLQADPEWIQQNRRRKTPLAVTIARGNSDLVRLLLCNGYWTELEPSSPLDDVLDARRWDLLELLLNWGTDPAGVDVCRVLDSYQRDVFERFYAAGVDLTAHGALAYTLADATRNRPLYGFVKNRCEADPGIQRALDVALVRAVRAKNAKAVSLCLWAGANPRRPVGDPDDDPAEDEDGVTALEAAISAKAPEFLAKLGFDPDRDDIDALYGSVSELETLKALVAIRPPRDWHPVTARFFFWYAFAKRFGFYGTGLYQIEAVFGLGGRLGALDPSLKRDLRRLLLTLDDFDAKRLFRLLRNSDNMERDAFLDLIGQKKLAERVLGWTRHAGVDRDLLIALAETSSLPAPVRRLAKARLTPPPRPVMTHTYLDDVDGSRLYSREELYELVWSEPLLTLSKRFGLSDNGLRKRCKAMNIPTPRPGYWQELRSGQRVKPAPLPRLPSQYACGK